MQYSYNTLLNKSKETFLAVAKQQPKQLFLIGEVFTFQKYLSSLSGENTNPEQIQTSRSANEVSG